MPQDHGQRRIYTIWVIELQTIAADFSEFSSAIRPISHVNKQNCRIWGFQNFQVTVERSLHQSPYGVHFSPWS